MMPDQAHPGAPSAQPPSAAARYIEALKVPVAVLCLIITVLVGYFFLYVQRQTDYLIGRNFRVLATAAAQVEATLESSGWVIRHLQQPVSDASPEVCQAGPLSNEDKRKLAVNYELRAAAKESGSVPILRFVIGSQWLVSPTLVPRFEETATSVTWYLNETALCPAELPLDLTGLLQQMLAGYAREGLFDSVLVTNNSGRVLFQTGNATLRLTSLDKLPDLGAKTPGQKLALEEMTRASNAFDVSLADGAYKLFLAPCCQSIHTMRIGEKDEERGWMIGGLVSHAGLSSAGYAVSFTFMALVIGALLLAVFSWPFVKLTLIGPLQRVRLFDVVLVGLCALLGGALVTLFVVDVYSYFKLKADLDGQLEAFAASIDSATTAELQAAITQLHALDNSVPALTLSAPGTEIPYLAWYRNRSVDLSAYPLFESFALINPDGEQEQKWALGRFVPPLVTVRDREYFTHWQRPAAGAGHFVEAVLSKTTGSRELVVSVPSANARESDKRARSRQWVASLAVQDFRSLLDTAIVPGFAFAIVDGRGDLLFHSDPQHASENLFAETDSNRRLRALVAARQRGWLNMRYFGEDHRAFVSQMSGQGLETWSLVTFYDQSLVRTVNVEWLVGTIFFIMLYASVYVGGALGIHALRPAYRAPWLWPDPARSRTYVDLLVLELLLIAFWGVAMAFFPNGDLLWSAWMLPVVTWSVAYLSLTPPERVHAARPFVLAATVLLAVLWISQSDRWLVVLGFSILFTAAAVSRRWLPGGLGPVRELPLLKFCYGGAAIGCAVLTIVLPTAAFFRIAHGLQTASFLKYGQLKLAAAVRDRTARHELRTRTVLADLDSARFDELSATRRGLGQRGVYDTFFYNTTIDPAADCADVDASSHDLSEAFEERLPYYSESSVQLRELVHDRAPGHWEWCQPPGQLVMKMNGGERYRSDLPRLAGLSSPHWPLLIEVLMIVSGFLVLAVTTVWGVRFVMHHVFVIDLVDPLWAPTIRAPVNAGANMLLVHTGALDPAFIDRASHVVLDLGAVTADTVGAWERACRAELDRAEEWKNVLVEHLERALGDPKVKGAMLRLLEYSMVRLNRTVTLISTLPPSRLIGGGARLADRDAEQRWTQLLASFTPVSLSADAKGALPSSWQPAGEPAPVFGAVLWRASMGFLSDEAQDLYVGEAWRRLLPEGRAVPLDAAQLLVEADERLDRYYRLLWNSCTSEQKLVLLQIAQERLVNEKSRRIVRLLMARRLVVRRPNIRLVRETFRRFVVSASVGTDVMALEGQSTSTWDTVRWPFMVMLVATLAFFFTTQHELFNSTLGVVTGVAAGVPTILKVISLFGDKRSQS